MENKQLITKIQSDFLIIENRIAVERIINETPKKISGNVSSSVVNPAYLQADIKLQYILKVKFENIKKETNNNVTNTVISKGWWVY